MKHVLAFDEFTHNLIGEVAKEKNLKVQRLSHDFILGIDGGAKGTIYVYGNILPLNTAPSQRICSDKSAFSMIMGENNIPNVSHVLYKNPRFNIPWSLADLKGELKEHGALVLKDNFGSSGKNVFLIRNEKELSKAVRVLIREGKDIAVSPYIDYRNEYRLIMLDKECKLCYKKVVPFVVGNGKSDIAGLATQKYGDVEKLMLSKSKSRKVLKDKETLTLGWKHNLCMLSSPEEVVDQKLLAQLTALAKRVVDAINIRFCSVDLIETNPNEFKVLETNSIVSTKIFAGTSKENYKKIKDIFATALEKCLDK